MITNIDIAEEKFQQYLPLLKEIYPEERKDKTQLIELIKQYEEVLVINKTVVALGDNREDKLLFLSKNFEQITHHKISTILKWGSSFNFRILHPFHFSYPFVALRQGKKFQKNLPLAYRKNSTAYVGGLKHIDGKGNTRLTFLKFKVLLWTKDGFPDVSIMFGEEVTHLMKGGHYWLRFNNPYKKFAYVNKKGKKEFSDLISESELRVLELIAKKKTTAEIADQLFLSKRTVETHRKNMIQRVGAVDATALVHLCKMTSII